MKSFIIFFSLLLTTGSTAFNQKTSELIIDQTGSVHPWSHLEINNNPENFQFAIVTDRTGGHRPGVFEDAIHKLNLLQPEFVLSVGDLIEGYTRDREEIYRQWDEFNGFIDQLEMPFFYVAGNHDYINDVMAEIWEEKFGKSYYHFVYRDVLFLCLNSEEATKGSNMGGIEKPQFEYVKKVLENYPDVRWTLVFMHQPLWILDNTRYWPEVENLLKDRKHTVFVGHHHHYVKYTRNNGKYFMLATTGGISRLRGPDMGEFDHVVWVTMTDEGPVLANLLLEGIWHEDVVNEDIQRILSNNPLKIEPLMIRSDFFTGGVQEIVVRNDENVAMNYRLSLAAPPGFSSPDSLSGSLEPKGSKRLSIKIDADNPTRMGRIDPFLLDGVFSYQVGEDRAIRLMRNYRLAPQEFYFIDKANHRPVIDGNLKDWEALHFSEDQNLHMTGDISSYMGNEDLRLGFDMSYDDNYVYFAIKVTDKDIVLNPEKSTFQQDGIRVYLDSRPLEISASGQEVSRGKDYIAIFLSPAASKKDKEVIYQKDLLPPGTLISSSTDSEQGYLFYEFAVPAAWFKEMQGDNWELFRLNISAVDADSNGSLKQIWWQPEWRSEENVIASGMVRKKGP